MPFTFNFGGFDPQMFRGFQGFQGAQSQAAGGEETYTPPPKKERKPRKPIGNAFTRTLINLAVTLVFGCYALAHFAVKGLDGTTYFLLQDLAFILLTTAALWGAAMAFLTLRRLGRQW